MTHDFHPSSVPALYEIDVSIEDLAPAGSQSRRYRYRRVMDWDMETSWFYFHDVVTVAPLDAGAMPWYVRTTSNDGFQSADPLVQPTHRGFTGTFFDKDVADPDLCAGNCRDVGAMFDLDFGRQDFLTNEHFTLYYGAAETESEALDALRSVGADAYSLGQDPAASGPNDGPPPTFIFGVKRLGEERSTAGGSAVSFSERTMSGNGEIIWGRAASKSRGEG